MKITLSELLNNTVKTGCSEEALQTLRTRVNIVGYLATPALVNAIENPATRRLGTELLAALISSLVSQQLKDDLAVAANYGERMARAFGDTEWDHASRRLMIEIIATVLPLQEIIAIIRATKITLGNCAAAVFIESVRKTGDIDTLVAATADDCHEVRLPAIQALSLLERGKFDEIIAQTLNSLRCKSGTDQEALIYVAYGMLRHWLYPTTALEILAAGVKSHPLLVRSFFTSEP